MMVIGSASAGNACVAARTRPVQAMRRRLFIGNSQTAYFLGLFLKPTFCVGERGNLCRVLSARNLAELLSGVAERMANSKCRGAISFPVTSQVRITLINMTIFIMFHRIR